jgi:hypothetical protein
MERILGKIDRKVVIDAQVAKGALPVLPLGDAVGALTGAGNATAAGRQP